MPKTGQNTTKSPFPTGGGLTEKKLFLRKLRDSGVTFFLSDFGTPVALWPRKGLEGLACLLLAACLLDTQDPPWCPNQLINWLKFYELQLGDPNPNLGVRAGIGAHRLCAPRA